ncbi:MAG: hypothetical protein AB1938_12745 [Myxococcota bacterium]
MRLSDLGAALERIGAVTLETLARDAQATDDAALKALAARPQPALRYSERYLSNISFAEPMIIWPGQPQGQPPSPTAPSLMRIGPWLRSAFVTTLPSDLAGATPAEQEAAFDHGDSQWMRIAVALADGAFTQYPARELPRDFDARKRAWYRVAQKTAGLHWDVPVPGPLGRTLRLPVALPLQRDGQDVGVAMGDLSVPELTQRLALVDMPGFLDAYLVTAEGLVTARRGLEAQVLKPGMNLEAALDLPRLADAELLRRMAAGEHGGYIKEGEKLVVFSRLISPPWYYVAEFDRAPYLSTAQRETERAPSE